MLNENVPTARILLETEGKATERWCSLQSAIQSEKETKRNETKKPKFLSAVSDQILYTDDILSEPTPLLCPKTVFKHMERVSNGESSVVRFT